MEVFVQSLILFIPIVAANQAALFIRFARLPDISTSVRLFGKNKTLMPLVIAPLFAMITLSCLGDPSWLLNGGILGWGVVVAEHAKSFLKRRLGLEEGAPFFLDRIDFAVGGGVAAYWFFFPPVTIEHVLCIVAIAYPVHLIGNRFSHSLGWRDTPH